MSQPSDPDSAQPQEDSTFKSFMSVLGSVGLPVTVVSALMLYFGWARTDQQARYMGLDVSLFGFTTQDYVMRSISTLFIPLLALGILGLAWLGLHQAVRGWLTVRGWLPALRTAGRIAFAAGIVAAAGALVAVSANRTSAPLVAPLVLAGGTAVAAYGLWLSNTAGLRLRVESKEGLRQRVESKEGSRGRVESKQGLRSRVESKQGLRQRVESKQGLRQRGRVQSKQKLPPGQRALRAFLVAGIISLALFWELSNYAGVVGRGYALQLADTVGSMPRAIAFSSVPLGVVAPGVREERIAEDPPGYRTTGLRLLARSGGRIFLLHDGWTPQRGTVIVLPDGPEVSWQFSR